MTLNELTKRIENYKKWTKNKETEEKELEKARKELFDERFKKLRPLMDEDLEMAKQLCLAKIKISSFWDDPYDFHFGDYDSVDSMPYLYDHIGGQYIEYRGSEELTSPFELNICLTFLDDFERFHKKFHQWLETAPELQEHLILEFEEPCLYCGETWCGTTNETLRFTCPCGREQHACNMCYANCDYKIGSEDCKGCIWEHVCRNLEQPKTCDDRNCPSEHFLVVKDGQAYLKEA